MLFQSGLEKTYTFYLYDDAQIRCSIEGDLAQYAIIKDPNPDGGPRNVEVVLTLPDYLEPGTHTLFITATQSAGIGMATVGGVASVRTGVTVFALYPGKRPVIDGLSASDLNINEKKAFSIEIMNTGEEPIIDAKGLITIYDQDNNTVAILRTDSVGIGAFEKQSVSAVLDAALYNLSVGRYTDHALFRPVASHLNRSARLVDLHNIPLAHTLGVLAPLSHGEVVLGAHIRTPFGGPMLHIVFAHSK